MLRQCWWQGRLVNCSEIFTPVITDSGVCCGFNLKHDLKESSYSSLVNEMQVCRELLPFTFPTHLSFQEKAGPLTEPSVWKIAPGADQGLKVILDRNFDRCKNVM